MSRRASLAYVSLVMAERCVQGSVLAPIQVKSVVDTAYVVTIRDVHAIQATGAETVTRRVQALM